MSKETIMDGQNRCQRCNRPLSNPADRYGWRCAQIVGINNYQLAAEVLDDEALMLYNAYAERYLDNVEELHKNVEGFINVSGDRIGWTGKMLSLNDRKFVAKNLARYGWLNDLQRGIWRLGAQKYLREQKGYFTSAWMLEHSLEENPCDIWRGNNSRIAYLINHDQAYLSKLDDAIRTSKDGTINQDLKDIAFENGDLYYSIHMATIHVEGYKQSNGKWIVHATMRDTYDFTKIQTLMAASGEFSMQVGLGTIANDAAVISQYLGAIVPYKVTVDFYTTR